MTKHNPLMMLTTRQVAELLGAGESSVRLWCTIGRLPNATRIGRDWLIPETDLEGFEKRGRGRPPGKPGHEDRVSTKRSPAGKRVAGTSKSRGGRSSSYRAERPTKTNYTVRERPGGGGKGKTRRGRAGGGRKK